MFSLLRTHNKFSLFTVRGMDRNMFPIMPVQTDYGYQTGAFQPTNVGIHAPLPLRPPSVNLGLKPAMRNIHPCAFGDPEFFLFKRKLGQRTSENEVTARKHFTVGSKIYVLLLNFFAGVR
jgi:hypothetical protein